MVREGVAEAEDEPADAIAGDLGAVPGAEAAVEHADARKSVATTARCR